MCVASFGALIHMLECESFRWRKEGKNPSFLKIHFKMSEGAFKESVQQQGDGGRWALHADLRVQTLASSCYCTVKVGIDEMKLKQSGKECNRSRAQS